MEEKQEAVESQAEGLIKELEQEITVLKKKELQLDQLSNAENYLQKIQIYSSMCSPPQTKNWTEISINTNCSGETLKTSLSHLHKHLNNEMKNDMQKLKQRSRQKAEAFNCFNMNWTQLLLLLFLPVAIFIPMSKAIWIQIYAVEVTLDPDTASNYLILSEDGKQVRIEDYEFMDVPYNPERFVNDPYVLAKEGFSSGRFYYEVLIRGKTEWDLGVARGSVNRDEEVYPNYKYGTWSFIRRHGNDYRVCAGSCVRVTVKEKVERVGVFVDYEEGLVAFYDAEARSYICSVTGQSFTEKLYPFFSPGFAYEDENTEPLIIYDGYKYLITLRQFLSRVTMQRWF